MGDGAVCAGHVSAACHRIGQIARDPGPQSPGSNYGPGYLIDSETRLYDLVADPGQTQPLSDASIESEMIARMLALTESSEAPVEAYARPGLAGRRGD